MKKWPLNRSSFGKNKNSRPVRRRRLDDPEPIASEPMPTINYRRHSNLNREPASSRQKVHQLKKKQKSVGLLFLLASCLIASTVWLLYHFSGRLEIALYGQVSLGTDLNERFEGSIRDYLNQRPLERIRPLTNREALASYMQSHNHAEVASITDIKSDGVGASRFIVKVRQPVAQWILDKKVYYVDKEGVIFATNYFDKPVVKITDQSGLSEALSGQVLNVTSRRFLDFIGQSLGRLSSSGLEVRQVIIPPNTTRMVEFELKDKTLIRMTVDRPVGEQSEDATRALSFLRHKKTKAQYIDVRVGGRAFYR